MIKGKMFGMPKIYDNSFGFDCGTPWGRGTSGGNVEMDQVGVSVVQQYNLSKGKLLVMKKLHIRFFV